MEPQVTRKLLCKKIAGINAALKADSYSKEFELDRTESYIGVMIDDLITRGVPEPYRCSHQGQNIVFI